MNALSTGGLILVALTAAVTSAVADGRRESHAVALATAQQACAALANRTAAGATVLAAEEVAASDAVPAYCRISARILPSLNFELRLPTSWNGKLHYGGGGGYNGSIPPLAGTNLAALEQGYINVGSDSGHQGSGFDSSWAIGNSHAEQLYGYLSVPTVMSSAVELIEIAYGRRPSRSYFEGCSNGGREGLVSAERFPNLFDGIIAACPVVGMPALVGAFNRTVKALEAPGGSLTPAKLALVSKAVLAACDQHDGIADGVISNPSACNFRPQVLRCKEGGDTGESCLSDAQIAVMTAWTTPAVFAGGAAHYPGFALTGSEGDRGSWDSWVQHPKSPLRIFQDTGIKNLLERDPTVNTLTYDYNSNPAALSRWTALVDTTNPDLRPFRDSGGKLILWHGSSDMSLSERRTSEYYRSVVAAVGGQASADAFVHYYVLPAVNHCRGGRGADTIDMLAALDHWVESGTAPAGLTASKLAADGGTVFTRPVCKYPQYPRYTGSANDAGAAKLAENYTCTTP